MYTIRAFLGKNVRVLTCYNMDESDIIAERFYNKGYSRVTVSFHGVVIIEY